MLRSAVPPSLHHSITPLLRFLRKPLHLQPEDAVARPGMALLGIPSARAQAKAMLALLVDVQIERDPGFAHRFGEFQAVLDRHGTVFVGGPDEARRRLFGYLEFIGQVAD